MFCQSTGSQEAHEKICACMKEAGEVWNAGGEEGAGTGLYTAECHRNAGRNWQQHSSRRFTRRAGEGRCVEGAAG